MSYNQNIAEYQRQADDAASTSLIRKVYLWMSMALAISGLTAYYVASSPQLLQAVFASKGTFLVLILAEFGLVIGLSAAIDRLSALTATLMFLLYSVINGVTLSSIFVVYEIGSIATSFYIAAGTFACMALYGSVSRKDLTSVGSICMMALFGALIALVVNLFMHNSVLDLIVSGVVVLIFTGLTAYDAQKIKTLLYDAPENDTTLKLSVLGALTMYLDFINIFLYLLRFFGRRN